MQLSYGFKSPNLTPSSSNRFNNPDTDMRNLESEQIVEEDPFK